ncbi:alpha/beta fold hydrolase [Chloroflexota bacterium]
MQNLRMYGGKPYSVVVIHGGPGAPGEVAPVARELSVIQGVLEPLQTERTIEGQIHELKSVIEENGDTPLILVGFSWGAMLSFIFTARYPLLVRKLVLISSGVYEEKYAADIMSTRLNRLTEKEVEETIIIIETLNDPEIKDKNALMLRFGELMAKADSYNPLPHNREVLEYQYDINQSVWGEASELRSNGELLKLGLKIRCPVAAIHGDYDTHLAEGVKVPLSGVLKDFKFILLKNCGHEPWLERDARDEFYKILKKEVRQSTA